MRLLYDNQVENATITSSSENSSYQWNTALLDTRLSRFGRTTGVTGEWIKFNISNPSAVYYLCILSHNLTSDAIVYIQANSSDSFSSPAFNQLIPITAGVNVSRALTSAQTYQYWRLLITDTTNTAGYLQIGLISLCGYLQMPWPDAGTSNIPVKTTSKQEISDSGQSYLDIGYQYRQCDFTFTDVLYSDVKLIEDIFNDVDIGIPVILLIWEDALTVEPALYCTMSSIERTRSGSQGVYYNIKLSFMQVF